MKSIEGYAFPETPEEASEWEPKVLVRALARKVLVVAQTRIEGAWAAYCDAVPGKNHDYEANAVLREGDKLPEKYARTMFPEFKDLPYGR